MKVFIWERVITEIGEALPNGHIVAIGASGSGKTQTLKAIAFSLHQTYPQMQVILLEFHGDREIIGETCYPIHMASPHGIRKDPVHD